MTSRMGPRDLLWAGVVAPVLFTAVYLIEGATRPGYDALRHQVSLLSLGSDGWTQILAFLVTGALLVLFAIGLRAVLESGPGARGAPLAIGITGAGFMIAGVFTTQPLFGYPPGTPHGMATDVTAASLLHVLGAAMAFGGLIGAAVILARRFWRAGSTGRAAASLAVALIVLAFFGASGGGPSGQLLFPEVSGLLQRISLVAGLGWIAAIALLGLTSDALEPPPLEAEA